MFHRSFLFAVAWWLATGGALAQQPPLHVATYSHYPPWTVTTAEGVLTGFEIDLIHDLCRRIARTCRITPENWDTMIPSIRDGRFDAYIGAMTITDERAQRVGFTVPYAYSPEFFAARSDSDLVKLVTMDRLDLDRLGPEERDTLDVLKRALSGRIVGVHSGTIYQRFMETYLRGVSELRIYHSEHEKYLDVAAGKLDAVLDGGAALMEFINGPDKLGHDLTLFGPALTGGPLGRGMGIAVPPGAVALREALDNAIHAAAADGTIARISLQWFGYNVSVN
ncbi:MAG: transporter substrate-binding domain-containing protein [Azospirillum sp.]|nr:transporter substrate-binding domain-containing protein [Azospirillum sp.]